LLIEKGHSIRREEFWGKTLTEGGPLISKRKYNDGAGSIQGQIIQIDEPQNKVHLDEMVRGTVEEILNRLLDAEAVRLVGAGRYERSADRQDTRAGHYERSFDMKVGRIKMQMPKLRKLSFETVKTPWNQHQSRG